MPWMWLRLVTSNGAASLNAARITASAILPSAAAMGAADRRVHARLADQQGEEGKSGDEELGTRKPEPPLRLGLDHSIAAIRLTVRFL